MNWSSHVPQEAVSDYTVICVLQIVHKWRVSLS